MLERYKNCSVTHWFTFRLCKNVHTWKKGKNQFQMEWRSHTITILHVVFIVQQKKPEFITKRTLSKIIICHLAWLNTLIMLWHFLSITHSFLYTNLISIAKVITRFMLLCQLSTKWLFVKQFRFSPPFQTSFTNVFFIINNTFKLVCFKVCFPSLLF